MTRSVARVGNGDGCDGEAQPTIGPTSKCGRTTLRRLHTRLVAFLKDTTRRPIELSQVMSGR